MENTEFRKKFKWISWGLKLKGSFSVEFNCDVYIHSKGLTNKWRAFPSPLMVNEYRYRTIWEKKYRDHIFGHIVHHFFHSRSCITQISITRNKHHTADFKKTKD